MLKYEINQKEMSQTLTEIPIIGFEMVDDTENADLLSVTCYYDEDINLTPETDIWIRSLYDLERKTINETETLTIEVAPVLTELNLNFRYFSFNINKYFDLKIKEIQIEERQQRAILRFIFEDIHYFNSWDTDIKFYVDFVAEDGTKYEKSFEGCEYEDEYTLVWPYDKESPDIDLFMCSVFHNDVYNFVGYEGNEASVEVEEVPASACFSDELYIKVPVKVGCDNRFEYYEKECNDGDVNGLDAYREQFITDFTVSADISTIQIPIPLSQMHDVTLLQEDNVMTNFVYDEQKRSINNVVEMEKYVYHPVYTIKPSTSNPTEFATEDIYKIKFNLHFRQRSGDDWTVEDDGFWNGVNKQTMEMEGVMDCPPYKAFFSYQNKSKQSDLLTYLGFTNSDVKFQKNKLKKSFLRLMFFDSDNPARQNMIGYSTIFLDGGKLFTKFMNHQMTSGYSLSNSETRNSNFTGVKVDFEYVSPTAISDEEMETYRLSSQLEVTDTYNSKSSSEGFYVYLWADNDKGNIPSDLYMKVEFNHAGLGRTIPFMMPYFDKKKDGHGGIKTFEQIMEDWRSGNGYGIRKYSKYSYIHLKYRYDKEKEKRVYYLDPETYEDDAYYNMKDNADSSPNEMEINLYEAKVDFS